MRVASAEALNLIALVWSHPLASATERNSLPGGAALQAGCSALLDAGDAPSSSAGRSALLDPADPPEAKERFITKRTQQMWYKREVTSTDEPHACRSEV